MVEYNAKVIDYFLNPRNLGEIKDADACAQVGNPVCGDIIEIYIKIDINENKEEYIKDIKFKTLGCAAAIATSSMLTEVAKGKTLKDALKIDQNIIIKELGGLPTIKTHCSNLAYKALRKAINIYLENKKLN
jgi:nitrogen fixation protein NifU and related proteins